MYILKSFFTLGLVLIMAPQVFADSKLNKNQYEISVKRFEDSNLKSDASLIALDGEPAKMMSVNKPEQTVLLQAVVDSILGDQFLLNLEYCIRKYEPADDNLESATCHNEGLKVQVSFHSGEETFIDAGKAQFKIKVIKIN